MSLRFIHVVDCINNLVLSGAEWFPRISVYHWFFIEGHLNWFYILLVHRIVFHYHNQKYKCILFPLPHMLRFTFYIFSITDKIDLFLS